MKSGKKKKDALAVLLKSPELIRMVFESVGDALLVVDADRNVIFWNRKAEELTGFDRAEVVDRFCLTGLRCESCLYECRLFETGEVQGAEVVLRSKDGGIIHAKKNAFLLRDGRGRVLVAVEILKDETALRLQIARCRAQGEEIARREQLSQAILGSIREGVVTLDPARRITSFSRRAEAITGFEAEAVLGRPCDEVFGAEICAKGCPVRECLEGRAAEADCASAIRSARGDLIPVVETAVPLRGEDGAAKGAVLILEDQRPRADAGRVQSLSGMVARSEAMGRVFRVVAQLARTEATVLITGESGTGKERVARALHENSPRRAGPFVAINCAALPEPLLESELFGHVRGAFTGAIRDKPGLIEEARGGTLLLDEIGEMSLPTQAKILRFLQEREFQRVGDSKTRSADVRILAATHRALEEEVRQGRFREDLYYRIRVIPVHVPPLRERREDIPLLAAELGGGIARRLGLDGVVLTPAFLSRLAAHPWPGNVRELENALEYAIALAPGRRIRAQDLPPEIGRGRRERYRESDGRDERSAIQAALEQAGGNKKAAAALLGMNRVTLYRKLRRHNSG